MFALSHLERSQCLYVFKKVGTVILSVHNFLSAHFFKFMLIFFAFDNDDMESSKRRVTFLSMIFLLKVCRNRSLSDKRTMTIILIIIIILIIMVIITIT